MPASFIGIATTDGVSVCSHLARCAGVVVVQVENGAIVSRSLRTRSVDACGQHGRFVDLVAGCQAVICGGIGQGAVDALAQHGIQSIVLAAPLAIDEAAAQYLAGTLATTGERVCLCG